MALPWLNEEVDLGNKLFLLLIGVAIVVGIRVVQVELLLLLLMAVTEGEGFRSLPGEDADDGGRRKHLGTG